MHKKSLILVSVVLFVLCIFSGCVFATNDVKNGISGAVNTVVDGVNNLGSDVRKGIGDAENGVEDALRMDNTADRSDDVDRQDTTDNGMAGTTGDYTASRTTADLTNTNNTSTLWIWLIVAVAAIVIIGLVWYYGAQNNINHHDE